MTIPVVPAVSIAAATTTAIVARTTIKDAIRYTSVTTKAIEYSTSLLK
mgnify:FL=1